jgi:DNA-binding protein
MPEEEQVVYIGKKPTMSYVLAAVTIFNNGFDELAIKARGRAISKAVDVAEIVRNRFVEGVKVKDIKISTEKVTNERGEVSVSSVEIYLTR